MSQQKQTAQPQLQQQQQKRCTATDTTSTATGRKRTHSSCSSTNSPCSPSTNLSSSDSNLSTTMKTNQLNKKKSLNRMDNSTGSSCASQFPYNSSVAFSPPCSLPSRQIVQRNVPAFLNKLYNMVEDLSTSSLIRWSKHGTSFIVEKHEEFAKTVLPRFYKHNTFASFVRQLNMYDFHKVPHLQKGVLISENEHEIWEFSNPHFQRGRPDLLVMVTRKRNRDRDNIDTENVSLSALAQDLSVIKKHQAAIGIDLRDLQRENEILWQETLSAREKYQNHQDAIKKILQFLTAVFVNDNLTITKNNKDLVPEGLIEEAASLAGIPTEIDEISKIKSTTAPSSNLSSSTLSDIISSVLRLYTANPLSTEQTDATQSTTNRNDSKHPSTPSSSDSYYPQSPQELNNLNDKGPSITDFSKALSTATRSAQSISQDIKMMQVNIESLANNLSLESKQFDEEMESDGCVHDNFKDKMEPISNLTGASKLYTEISDMQTDKKIYSQEQLQRQQQQQQQQLQQNMANMINKSNAHVFHLENPPTGQYRHSSQSTTGNSHHLTFQPQGANQANKQQLLRNESQQVRKLSYSTTSPHESDNDDKAKQQRLSDGIYYHFLIHPNGITDSFDPNYYDDGTASNNSTEYLRTTLGTSNASETRTNSLPMYYSTITPTTDGMITPTNNNNANNYTALANAYSGLMQPPYYYDMHDTNPGENNNDNF